MKAKPAEVEVVQFDDRGDIIKNIAIYLLCGCLNAAGTNPPN